MYQIYKFKYMLLFVYSIFLLIIKFKFIYVSNLLICCPALSALSASVCCLPQNLLWKCIHNHEFVFYVEPSRLMDLPLFSIFRFMSRLCNVLNKLSIRFDNESILIDIRGGSIS